MTSFLPFSWGRSRAHHDHHEHDVPGVTFSSSGETASMQPSDDDAAGNSILHTPQTPEGLRPRKSVETLRREWNICSAALDRFDQCSESRQQELALYVAPRPTHRQIAGPLPPPNFGQAISPQISTSTFYSSSSVTGRGIALSPHLKVGQARTAVGALVAMTDAARPKLETSRPSMQIPSNDPIHDMSVLPPRTWIEQDAYDEHESLGSHLSFHELDRSGNDTRKRKKRVSGSLSSTKDENTYHASPSSKNYRPLALDIMHQNNKQDESSFGWLMGERQNSGPAYDFDPIVNQDLFVDQTVEDEVNVSAISNSTISRESTSSFDDEEEEEHCYNYHYMKPENDEMAEIARRQRIKLQRQLKENTLVAMVTRLRDNERLVQDTLESLQQSTGHLRGMEPIARESIIKGFSKDTRNTVCRNIDAILTEMAVSIHEDLFLSPTQIHEVEETRDDLEHALEFCRMLVSKSISLEEQGESTRK